MRYDLTTIGDADCSVFIPEMEGLLSTVYTSYNK